MILGAISDTHGRLTTLRNALLGMGKVDGLLFAGDGLSDLGAVAIPAPLYQVRGNCDVGGGANLFEEIWLGDCGILLTHGHLHAVQYGTDSLVRWGLERGVDLVVFGHTHRPDVFRAGSLLLVNPGSIKPNRKDGSSTYAILHIDGKKIIPFIYEV